jgi:hypothetical protein
MQDGVVIGIYHYAFYFTRKIAHHTSKVKYGGFSYRKIKLL